MKKIILCFAAASFFVGCSSVKERNETDSKQIIQQFKETLDTMQEMLHVSTDSALYIQHVWQPDSTGYVTTPPTLFKGEFVTTTNATLLYFEDRSVEGYSTFGYRPDAFIFFAEKRASDTLFFYDNPNTVSSAISPLAAILPSGEIVQMDTTHTFRPGYIQERVEGFIQGVLNQYALVRLEAKERSSQ